MATTKDQITWEKVEARLTHRMGQAHRFARIAQNHPSDIIRAAYHGMAKKAVSEAELMAQIIIDMEINNSNPVDEPMAQ